MKKDTGKSKRAVFLTAGVMALLLGMGLYPANEAHAEEAGEAAAVSAPDSTYSSSSSGGSSSGSSSSGGASYSSGSSSGGSSSSSGSSSSGDSSYSSDTSTSSSQAVSSSSSSQAASLPSSSGAETTSVQTTSTENKNTSAQAASAENSGTSMHAIPSENAGASVQTVSSESAGTSVQTASSESAGASVQTTSGESADTPVQASSAESLGTGVSTQAVKEDAASVQTVSDGTVSVSGTSGQTVSGAAGSENEDVLVDQNGNGNQDGQNPETGLSGSADTENSETDIVFLPVSMSKASLLNSLGSISLMNAPAADTLSGSVNSVELPYSSATFGTSENISEEAAKKSLPSFAVLHTDSGDVTVEITGWTITGYDGTIAGDYTATASFTVPDGYTWDGDATLSATVHVVAGGNPISVDDGSAAGSATSTQEISQVGALETISVTKGTYTAASDLQSASDVLPKNATLYVYDKDGNATTVSAAITWNTSSDYNGSKVGAYVINGTFAVPDGYTLADGVANVIAVTVNVADAAATSEPARLTGASASGSAVSVSIGNSEYTDFDAIDAAGILPTTVQVTDGTNTYTVAVKSWTTPDGFDAKTAGTYTLTADLDLDDTLDYAEGYTAPTISLVISEQYRVSYDISIPAESLVAGSTGITAENVSAPASVLATENANVTPGSVTGADSLSAYKFVGWSDGTKGADGKLKVYSTADSYTVTGNVTLTAVWQKYVTGVATSVENGGLVENSGLSAYISGNAPTSANSDADKLTNSIYMSAKDGTLVKASVTWEWPTSITSVDEGGENKITLIGTITLPDGYTWADGLEDSAKTVTGALYYGDRTFIITNYTTDATTSFGYINSKGVFTSATVGSDGTVTFEGTSGTDTFELNFDYVPSTVKKLVIGSLTKGGEDTITAMWSGSATYNFASLALELYGRTITLTPKEETSGNVTLNLNSLTIKESPKSRLLGIQNQFNSDTFKVTIENFDINTKEDITIDVSADYNATLADDLGVKKLLTNAIDVAKKAAGATAEGVTDAAYVTTDTLQSVFDAAAKETGIASSVDVSDIGSNVESSAEDLLASIQAEANDTGAAVSNELTQLANSSLFVDVRSIKSAINIKDSSLKSTNGKISVTSEIKLGINVIGYFFPLAVSVADVDNTITVTNSTLKANGDILIKAESDVANNATAGVGIKIPAAIAVSVNNVNTKVLVNGTSSLTSEAGSVTMDADGSVNSATKATVSKSGNLQSAVIVAIHVNDIDTSATLEDTASIKANKDINITSDQNTVSSTVAKVSRRSVEKQHKAYNLTVHEILAYLGSLVKTEANGVKNKLFGKGTMEQIAGKLNESSNSVSLEETDTDDAETAAAYLATGTVKVLVQNYEKGTSDTADAVEGATVRLWYEDENGTERVSYEALTDKTGYASFYNLPVAAYYKGVWYYQLQSVPKKISKNAGTLIPDYSGTKKGIVLGRVEDGRTVISTSATATISMVNGTYDTSSGKATSNVSSGAGTKKNSTKQLVGAFGVDVSNEDNEAAIYSSGQVTAGGNVNVLANGVSNHQTQGEATAILPETSSDAAAMEVYVYDENGNPVKNVEITLTAVSKLTYADENALKAAGADMHFGLKKDESTGKWTRTWTTKTDANGIASFVVSSWYSNVTSLISNKIGTRVAPSLFDYTVSILIDSDKNNPDLQKKGYYLNPAGIYRVDFTENTAADGTVSYSWAKTVNLQTYNTPSEGKSSKAFGAGVGIAVNVINYDNSAYISGNAKIIANGLTVSALSGNSGSDDAKAVHNLSDVSAAAGYNVGDFGIGGAIGVNIFQTTTSAKIAESAQITLGSGTLTVTANENGSASTEAKTIQDGIITKNNQQTETKDNNTPSKSTGVGTGIAVSVYNNEVSAIVADGHYITNGKNADQKVIPLSDITITAGSEGTVSTNAQAGAQGGTAVSPVLAVDVLIEQIRAILGSGLAADAGAGASASTLNVSGNSTVSASSSRKKSMNANATASGNKAAFGGAFGVSVDFYETKALVSQNLYIANGSLRILSSGTHTSDSRTDGSANGAGNDGTSDGQGSSTTGSSTDVRPAGTGQSVDRKTSIILNSVRQVSNSKDGYGLSSKTPLGGGGTNSGSINIAGAVVLTIYNNSTTAILDSNAKVRYGLMVNALNSEDLSTVADSSATVSKIGVGVSVALQVINSDTRAYITNNAKNVEAGAIAVTALRRQSETKENAYYLRSTSGAGASNVGAAGAVTVAVVNLESDAFINMGKADNDTETPSLIATDGEILISSTAQNKTTAKANATTWYESGQATATAAKSVGVGASVGVIVVQSTVDAYIGNGNALLVKAAKDVTVKTQLGDAVVMNVAAGTGSSVSSADGSSSTGQTDIALDAVVGVPVVNTEQKASILDNVTVYAGGNLSAIAKNESTVSTTTKGAAESSTIAAGASMAVNIVYQDILAEIAADGAIGGNLIADAAADTTDTVDGIATAAGLPSAFLIKFGQITSDIEKILSGELIRQKINSAASAKVSSTSSGATSASTKTSTSPAKSDSSDASGATAENMKTAGNTSAADVAAGSVTKSGEKSDSTTDFFTNLINGLKDYLSTPEAGTDTSSTVNTSETGKTTAADVTSKEESNKKSSSGEDNDTTSKGTTKGTKNKVKKNSNTTFAVAAAFGVNIISHDVTARFTGTMLRAGGASVHASNNNDFRTHATGAAVSRTGSFSGAISVLVNNSDAAAELSGTVYIIGANKQQVVGSGLSNGENVDNVTGNVLVLAETTHNLGISDATVEAIAGSAALPQQTSAISVAGAVAVVASNATTDASLADNSVVTIENGDLYILSYEKSRISARAWGGAITVGGQAGVGVGASFAVLEATEKMNASIGSDAKTNANNVAVLAEKAKVTSDDLAWDLGINGYIELGQQNVQYGLTSSETTNKLYKKIQINLSSSADKDDKLTVSGVVDGLTSSMMALLNKLTASNYYLEAVGGAAAYATTGTGTVAAGGSTAVIYFENTVNASIGDGTVITLNTNEKSGAVKVNASADISALMLMGGVGVSNGSSIGVSAGAIADDDTVTAVVGKSGGNTVTISNIKGTTGLDVRASLDKDVRLGGVAASVAAGVANSFGADGVVGIIVSDSDTGARVYGAVITGADVSGGNAAAGNVTVLSNNSLDVLQILGGFALSTGRAAVGASIGVDVINAKSIAAIDSASKLGTASLPVGAVQVSAKNEEDILTVVVNGSVTSGQTTVSASPVVQVINAEALSLLDATSVYASSVNVKAEHPTELTTIGGALAVSNGSGLGGSIAVTVLNKETAAQFGNADNTSLAGISGDVSVTAEAKERLIPMVASFGLVTGGTGVTGSVNVVVAHNETTADVYTTGTIGDKLTVTADDELTMYAGAGSASMSAGQNAVGLATTDVILSNNTRALVNDTAAGETGNGSGSGSASGKTGSETSSLTVTGDAEISADSEENFVIVTLPISGSSGISVAPGITMLILGETTDAEAGGTIKAGSLAVKAKDNTDIKGFTITVAVSGQTAAGASVSTFTYNKNVKALVPEGSNIITESGDIRVQAENKDDELFITIGGAGGSQAAVSGSVSTIVVGSNITAGTADNVTLNSKGNVIVTVDNDLDVSSGVGSVSASATAAVGASVNTFVYSGTNTAKIGQGNTVTAGKGSSFTWWNGMVEEKDGHKSQFSTSSYTGVLVGVNSDENVTMIAVSGAGSGTAAVVGVVNTVVFKQITQALVDSSSSKKTTITSGGDVAVLAFDNTEYVSVAGQVSGSGTAAVGVATDTLVFNKTVKAEIADSAEVTANGSSTDSTDGNIYVRTGSHEYFVTVAAGVSGSGTAAVAGSVSTVTLNDQVSARVGDSAYLTADGSVSILADDMHYLNVTSGLANGAGVVGVGAGVSTVVEKSTVKAQAGSSSDIFAGGNTGVNTVVADSTTKKRSRQERRGVSIGAFNTGIVNQKVFSVSVSGVSSTDVASAAMINNATAQAIVNQSAKINQAGSRNREQHASSRVSVTAANDSESIAASAGGAGSTVGVVAASLVVSSKRTTEAKAESGAEIDGRDGVDVIAGSANKIGLTGFGLGGGLVGVSGSATVYLLTDTTTALLAGSVASNGTVNVLADSDQNVTLTSANAAGGGVAVGGTGAVFRFKGTTQALLADEAYICAKELNVKATGNSDLNSNAVAGTAGGVAVSGGVNIAIVENTVKAVAGSKVTIKAAVTDSSTNKLVYGDISFLAEDETDLTVNSGNVTTGAKGVGGAATVVIYRSTVTAGIGTDATVTGNDISVKANADRKVTGYTVAGSGGTTAVSGAVLVVLVGTGTDSDITAALGTAAVGTDGKAKSDGSSAYANADKTVADGFDKATITMTAYDKDKEGNQDILSWLYTNDSSSESVKSINDVNKAVTEAKPASSSVTTVFTAATGTEDKTSAYVLSGSSTSVTSKSNGTSDPGGITIEADESNTLKLVSGQASGGVTSAGGAVLIAKLYGTTEATSSARLRADGNITIHTSSMDTADDFYTVAGNAGVISLGASVSYLFVGSKSNAYAYNGSIEAGGTVNITADLKNTIKPYTTQISGGALVAGAAISITNVSAETKAYLGSSASITKAAGGVNITATSDLTTKAQSEAVAAGLLGAANGSVATLTVTSDTEAYAAGTVSNTSGTIGDTIILAQQLLDSSVKAGAYRLSGGKSGGASVATFSLNPTVKGYTGGNVAIDGKLYIYALYNIYEKNGSYRTDNPDFAEKDAADVAAYAVGLAWTADFSGAVSVTDVKGTVEAYVENTSKTPVYASDIAIYAYGSIKEKTYTGDLGAAVYAGVGASVVKVTSAMNLHAYTKGSLMTTGAIAVYGYLYATHTDEAAGLAGSLVAAGNAEDISLSEASTVMANMTYSGSGTNISAGGSILVVASAVNTADVKAKGIAVAGVAGANHSKATVAVNTKSTANIGSNLTINASGAVYVNSSLTNTQNVDVKATSASLAGAYSNAQGTITDTGTSEAYIGTKTTVKATGYLTFVTEVDQQGLPKTVKKLAIRVNADGEHYNTLNVSENNGSAVAKGAASGTATVTNNVNAYVKDNSTLEAGQGIDILALGTSTISVNGTGATNISGIDSSAVSTTGNTFQNIKITLGNNSTIKSEQDEIRMIASSDVYKRITATLNWTSVSVSALSLLKANASANTYINVDVVLGDGLVMKADDILIEALNDRTDVYVYTGMKTTVILNTQSRPTASALTKINTRITAKGTVDLEATGTLSILAVSDKDISIRVESYGEASGTTGSVISKSTNTVNLTATITLDNENNIFKGNQITITASSPVSSDVTYVNDASYTARTVTEWIEKEVEKITTTIEKVTEKIVKKLPWPLNKIVKWVVKTVIKVVRTMTKILVEKVLQSETDAVSEGSYANNNTVTLKGNIYYGKTVTQDIVIDAGGNVTGLSSDSYSKDDAAGTITFTALGKPSDGGLHIEAYGGKVSGEVTVHNNNVVGDVTLINRSSYKVIIKSLNVEEIDENAQNYEIIGADTDSFKMHDVTEIVESPLINITGTNGADVVFSGNVTNLDAILTVDLQNGGSVYFENGASVNVYQAIFKAVQNLGTSAEKAALHLYIHKKADGTPEDPTLSVDAAGDAYVTVSLYRIVGENDAEKAADLTGFRNLHFKAAGTAELTLDGAYYMYLSGVDDAETESTLTPDGNVSYTTVTVETVTSNLKLTMSATGASQNLIVAEDISFSYTLDGVTKTVTYKQGDVFGEIPEGLNFTIRNMDATYAFVSPYTITITASLQRNVVSTTSTAVSDAAFRKRIASGLDLTASYYAYNGNTKLTLESADKATEIHYVLKKDAVINGTTYAAGTDIAPIIERNGWSIVADYAIDFVSNETTGEVTPVETVTWSVYTIDTDAISATTGGSGARIATTPHAATVRLGDIEAKNVTIIAQQVWPDAGSGKQKDTALHLVIGGKIQAAENAHVYTAVSGKDNVTVSFADAEDAAITAGTATSVTTAKTLTTSKKSGTDIKAPSVSVTTKDDIATGANPLRIVTDSFTESTKDDDNTVHNAYVHLTPYTTGNTLTISIPEVNNTGITVDGNADVNKINANGDVTLNVTGDATLTSVTAGGNGTVTVGGDATIKKLTAKKDAAVSVTGDAKVTTISADGNVTLSTTNGDITVSYLDGKTITIAAEDGSVLADALQPAKDANIYAETLSLTAGTGDKAGTIGSNDNPVLTDLQAEAAELTAAANGSIYITDVDGEVNVKSVTANGWNSSVLLNTNGTTKIDSIQSDAHVVMNVAGDAVVDTITAGDTVKIQTTGNITAVAKEENEANIKGDYLTIISTGGVVGTKAIPLTLNDAGWTKVSAVDDVYVKDISTKAQIESIESKKGSIFLETAADTFIESGTASVDATVKSGGKTAIYGFEAGRNMDIDSDGAVTAFYGAAKSNLDISAETGDITINYLDGKDVDINANGGNVLSGRMRDDYEANIYAETLALTTAKGGGIGTSGNPLKTDLKEDAAKLTAAADGSVYITDVDGKVNVTSITASGTDADIVLITNGDTTVGYLKADTVTATTSGGNFAVDKDKAVDGINITTGTLNVTASGAIGSEDSPVIMDLVDEAVLNAQAGGSLYAEEKDGNLVIGTVLTGDSADILVTDGDLTIGTITAGDTADLVVKNGNVTAVANTSMITTETGTETVYKPNVTADTLNLTVPKGSVGTETGPLRTDLTGDAVLNLTAKGDVYVTDLEDKLNVHTFATDGNAVLVTNGTLSISKLSGKDLTVTAADGNVVISKLTGNEVSVTAADGSVLGGELQGENKAYIYAQTLNLTAGNGDIGAENKYMKLDLSDKAMLNADATESIYIESVGIDMNIGSMKATGTDSDIALKVPSDITADVMYAGQDVIIASDKSITITTSVSAGRDVSLTSGEDTTVEAADAGRNLTITSTGDAKVTKAEAENDLTVTSTGNAEITTAEAGNDAAVTSEGTTAIGTIKADNDLTVTSTGNTEITTATAGNDAAVKSEGTTTIGMIKADHDTSIDSSKEVTITSGTAGNTLDIDAESGDITVTYLDGKNIFLTTENGSVFVTEPQEGKNANIYAGTLTAEVHGGTIGTAAAPVKTDSDLLTASADGSIYITDTGEQIQVTSIKALGKDSDVVLATSGNTFIDYVEAGNDVKVTVDNGKDDGLALQEAIAGGDFILTSGNKTDVTRVEAGNDAVITSGGTTQIGGVNAEKGRISVQSDGDTNIDGLEAAKDISVISGGDAFVYYQKAGTDISVEAEGDTILFEATAGKDLSVNSGGETTAYTIAAGNDAVINSAKDVRVVLSGTAKDKLDITADSGDVLLGILNGKDVTVTAKDGSVIGGDLTEYDEDGTAVNNTDYVNVYAETLAISATEGDIGSADTPLRTDLQEKAAQLTASATGSIYITDMDGDVNVKTITASGENSDIVLTTHGDTVIENANACHDATITVNGDDNSLTLTNGKAGNDLNLTTEDGDVIVKTAEAGHDATVTSGGTLTIGDLAAGSQLDLTAGKDLTITGSVQAGDAALKAENLKLGEESIVTANTVTVNTITADFDGTVNSGRLTVNTSEATGYIDRSMGETSFNLISGRRKAADRENVSLDDDFDAVIDMVVRSTDQLTVLGSEGAEKIHLDLSGASGVGNVRIDGVRGKDEAELYLNDSTQTSEYDLSNLERLTLHGTQASENITLTDEGITFDQRNVRMGNIAEATVYNPGGNNYWTFIDTPTVLTIYSGDGDDTYQIGILAEENGYIRTTEGMLTRGNSYPLAICDEMGYNRFIIFPAQAPVTIDGTGDVTFRRFWVSGGRRYVLYETAEVLLNGEFTVTTIIPPDPNLRGGRSTAGYENTSMLNADGVPKTGDTNRTILWLILMLAAMSGLAGAAALGRRQRNRRN